MKDNLAEKVVLITGPTGNLGRAVVKKFYAQGARLILVDHHPDRLPILFPELANDPRQLLIPGVDLANSSQVDSILGQSLNSNSPIDCLVCTAGGFRMGEKVHEISDQNWDYLLDLNLKTLLNTIRIVVPKMLVQGFGKIVTIGARPALAGKNRMGAYSVAKSGVLRLTETMSAEYKASGINVNCVLPGTIDTPQNREALPEADTSKWVTPDSLAEVIYFLCSESARDIHGAAIPVYGA
jgi:NAD(P)-dependent dehydrogenase (short-subunit alcohol dehydrogenase family)